MTLRANVYVIGSIDDGGGHHIVSPLPSSQGNVRFPPIFRLYGVGDSWRE